MGFQYRRCSVLGCHNRPTKGISFFRLPKDQKRAKLWLKAIRREPASMIVVCETHFESDMISTLNTRKRLARDAVPTRRLPAAAGRERRAQHRGTHAPGELLGEGPVSGPLLVDVVDDAFVKEETVVGPPPAARAPPGPGSRPPLVKRETPDDTSEDLRTLFALSRAYLDPKLAKCIEIQLLIKNETKQISESDRSDEKLLLHALKLHLAFPQTYRSMRELLGLPSVADVKRLFRPLTWEIDERWALGLRARFAGAAAGQLECAVCVAGGPLRPALAYDAARDRLAGLDELDGTQRPRAARRAVFVVARGVHARWRQPLACCLLGADDTAAEFRLWLDIILAKLFDIGLKVRALVTDYDDGFVNRVRPLTSQKPYFSLNNRQIYRLYDCTRMMIGFRDYLMRTDIRFDDKTASWADVTKLYEHDCSNEVKLAPGLSDTHVRPTRARVGHVALALGALTQPVAGALAIAAERGVLPASALGTAQLLNSVSALYETLHEKELPTKIVSCVKNALTFLKDMSVLFDKLSPVDEKFSRPERAPGAALAGCARAALALAERARVAGHATLPMRAFNNDPLHEFFDRLREGFENPTSERVLNAFRKSFAFNVMKPLERLSGEDCESFLMQAGLVRGAAAEAPAAEEAPPARAVPRAHWAPLLAAEREAPALPRLARQMLQRCLQRHACCAAGRAYCSREQAPADALRLLAALERQFAAHARAPAVAGALRPLLARAAEVSFDPPCACFPVLYLKTLYMRFRLESLIIHNNYRFKCALKNNTMVDYELNALD